VRFGGEEDDDDGDDDKMKMMKMMKDEGIWMKMMRRCEICVLFS